MNPRRDAQAGFTLVEVLVALVLFALIGAAGLAVLDQVLRVQERTDGRLERLAQLQRAMHLVTTDFMQAAGGSVSFADGAVALRGSGGDGHALRYGLEDAALVRRVSAGIGQSAARQVLLTGASGLEWRFYAPDTGWAPDWPPATIGPPRGNPAAVELRLTLAGAGLTGVLRRVTILPAEARR